MKLACIKAQRDMSSVNLIAVSKTHSSDLIYDLFKLGQRDFGENYVQEALQKIDSLNGHKLNWHFIGNLQSNKVKKVVGKFKMIHSVASFELAEHISKCAVEKNLAQEVLFEINLGNEIAKKGFSLNNFEEYFPKIIQLPNIVCKGLMALPPIGEHAESVRPYLHTLKNFFSQMKEIIPADKKIDWQHLSMGTTTDFEIAIEEGATFVRIGTAIFGERKKESL